MSFESQEPCVCCGTIAVQRTYHHLITQKTRNDLRHVSWNMISVCRVHHNEFHDQGINHMANKYKAVFEWLINNGWQKDFFNKWRRYV